MNGFLERLRRASRRAPQTPPDLNARLTAFREVLQANNSALGYLSEIQEALSRGAPLSAAEVRRLTAGVTVQTYRMVINLLRVSGRRHRGLQGRFDDLRRRIARAVEVTPFLGEIRAVVPLADLDASMAETAGQKSAFLGEARRILGQAVPGGFATTSEAYREFMAEQSLGERIREALSGLDAADVAACFRASARVTQWIEGAPVPVSLRDRLEEAAREVDSSARARFAVRSSALEEGGLEVSFAGQYRSFLNVAPGGIADAYRSVIASKYSPQAIVYRASRGFDEAEVAMCCCVLAMVDAAAGGVLYTEYPSAAGPATLIQAVRGLGLSAVDGSAEPDSYLVDRASSRVIESRTGRQETCLRCSAMEGTEKADVAKADSGVLILERDQVLRIARLAWRLQDALGMPLDVEWALDRAGGSRILQVRPRAEREGEEDMPRPAPVAGASVLLQGGARASRGAAAGAVHRVETDLDILSCPQGAILVTAEANPRLAVLLPSAAGIIADLGEVTGHLATVARELKVPALFAARTATRDLAAGRLVTLDADGRVVYDGRVEEALAAARPTATAAPRHPHLERLQEAAGLITPLTLRDRLASGYSPRRCKTLHDIIRFCHQATIESMFDTGDRAVRRGEIVRRLVSPVPIDCRLIDLGGGVRPGAAGADLTLEDVTSAPLLALWRGMTDPRLRWRATRPVSLRGFMSALVNYNFDSDARVRSMGEPSYAFVTSDYMNLNSRIGYHFSTVDARICAEVESNYASFRFVGGSTGIDQRSRRAVLIQRLLAAGGFETDCRADLVNARLRHRPAGEMREALTSVGLLMGFVNHLDMALTSDAVIDVYEAAFLEGRYGFKGGQDDE